MPWTRHYLAAVLVPLPVISLLGVVIAAATVSRPERAGPGARRTDPAWYGGKAEWALYDAVRPIYGQPRRYEATIFTNKQMMDPKTTVKASDPQARGSVEVFKHNLSEMIPTKNYTYRFLTTCFVRTDTLEPYKIVASSQEDCGATYKQFVVAGSTVRAEQFCYFPQGGNEPAEFDRPADLAFHDTLSLTLRDYPFDDPRPPTRRLSLVPDQTDTHETRQTPGEATVGYVERVTLDVPYGSVDTHHLRVTHGDDGGRTTTDYWFAADPALRHVMVRYAGPYGVRYDLKKLDWWAYWSSTPAPS